MDEQILMGVYIMLGILVFYKLSKFITKPKKQVRDEINNIIHSDKYKVKGKWEDN